MAKKVIQSLYSASVIRYTTTNMDPPSHTGLRICMCVHVAQSMRHIQMIVDEVTNEGRGCYPFFPHFYDRKLQIN